MDSKLIALSEAMRQSIHGYIRERGQVYAEEGRVGIVRVDDETVCALVTGDSGDYEIVLDRCDFVRSTCNCPYEGLCKHIAAVVHHLLIEEMTEVNPPSSAPVHTEPFLTIDTLFPHLETLSKEALLETVRLASKVDVKVAAALVKARQLVEEREELVTVAGDLEGDAVLAEDYLQSMARESVDEFAALIKRQEYSDWDERAYRRSGRWYPDDEEMEWDIEDAQSYLVQVFDSLASVARSGFPLFGMMGLALLHHHVRRWRNETEVLESWQKDTLLDPCLDRYEVGFAWVREHSGQGRCAEATDQLIDWILRQCQATGDLSHWTIELSSVLGHRRQLETLRAKIERIWPGFLRGSLTGDTLRDGARRHVYHWWVQLCLRHSWIEEAESTFHSIPAMDPVVAGYLAQAVAKEGQWDKALAYGRLEFSESMHENRVREEMFDRMIEWSKAAGHSEDAKVWRRRAFFVFPSYERLERCLGDLVDEERDSFLREWLSSKSMRGREELVALVNWMLHDQAAALRYFDRSYLPDPSENQDVARLLRWMDESDPTTAIKARLRYVVTAIDQKERKQYRRAAHMLTIIRELFTTSGNQAGWDRLKSEIHTKYSRFPALMQELRAAGV
ncbi:MAG: SWIM zinc finger family protein [Firmicutes bacterium]|nr:SWIM zinc finger family protein [Bacillota bacterium]